MAKMRMVTRTVKVTKVNVMCLDIEKGEAFNECVTVSGVFDSPEKLLKACKEALDTDTEKAVAIVEKKEIEQLYGMSEQEFINIAKILPPRQEKDAEHENMEANETQDQEV